jgi:hypothetical protein
VLVWRSFTKVEGSVLGLEQREQATTDQRLAINGRSQVVRRVATGRDIRQIDDCAEGILHYCQPTTSLWIGDSSTHIVKTDSGEEVLVQIVP